LVSTKHYPRHCYLRHQGSVVAAKCFFNRAEPDPFRHFFYRYTMVAGAAIFIDK
jgi:hypothetical protein